MQFTGCILIYTGVNCMRIYIDADGCSVTHLAIKEAKKHGIPVTIICDTSHEFKDDYAEIITVDKGADSVDFKLVNMTGKGDIVITQDYGLAAMCLAKKSTVLNQNGMVYNNTNIDSLLSARHTARKIRNAGGRLKSLPKRTQQQNADFLSALIQVICLCLNSN